MFHVKRVFGNERAVSREKNKRARTVSRETKAPETFSGAKKGLFGDINGNFYAVLALLVPTFGGHARLAEDGKRALNGVVEWA